MSYGNRIFAALAIGLTIAAIGAAAPAAARLTGSAAQAHNHSDGAKPGKVIIKIDNRKQRMTVFVGGVRRYFFRVSTGKAGYRTPRGTFRPVWLTKMHYSREYNNAKMPNSIFFTRRGHAIHGTSAIRRLGRPASHGCVRLALRNAAVLFALVKHYGKRNVSIRIV